jgi:hypothetical protein
MTGPTDPALRALAEVMADVEADHRPNEWDSCVRCRVNWPCSAELLREFASTSPRSSRSGTARC